MKKGKGHTSGSWVGVVYKLLYEAVASRCVTSPTRLSI